VRKVSAYGAWVLLWVAGVFVAPTVAAAAKSADFVLSTADPASGYNPTYLGNGYMGVRVPAAGEGFQSSPIATEAHVAGLYEQYLDSGGLPGSPGVTALDVAIPQWTGLDFSDGTAAWSPSTGQVLRYRQTLDMLTGVLATSVTWRSPSGRVTSLTYTVMVDRARMHVGEVTMTFTPHWSGTATVEDVLGPGGAVEVEGAQAIPLNTVSAGASTATATNRYVASTPSGYATMAETSRVVWSRSVKPVSRSASTGSALSTLSVSFRVRAGRRYTVSKVVGVATSNESRSPQADADAQATDAARVGAARLLSENARAWRSLWRSRTDVAGDRTLDQEVHAALFYLMESINPSVDTSTPPGGLSSGGYNGHVFWDAETWMYPALLAGHPALARSMDAYRELRLAEAERYAAAAGYSGARFPWESAATGGEEAPPPWGTLEQHISADVALAQWQYFLATGDRQWLAQEAWPVISQVADFWASRAVHTLRGYEILGVMPPDEYNFPVNDSTYTNVAVETAVKDAADAARVLGKSVPTSWMSFANGVYVPFDPALGIHPEYDGYDGRAIKQADTIMLTYPWEYATPRSVATVDLDYYVPRTDPNGPSMTDSINAIDTMALHVPGCSEYTFLRRSIDPFVRAPFDQMSETRSGGTFTFLTGTGGFLQTFLYGFTGFRWRADRILLDPSLPPQLHGVVDRGLRWHGRTFTVDIRPSRTTVTLVAGPPALIQIGATVRLLRRGNPVLAATGRNDRSPTSDVARCRPISSSAGGPYPFAANDGSPATAWFGATATDTLTIDLASPHQISRVVIDWASTPPSNPSGGLIGTPQLQSATLTRATDYRIDISTNGRDWRTIREVTGGTGPQDTLIFNPALTRYIRLVPLTDSNGVPGVEELSAYS
jgi:trehalose/maltose hydrolase-like predicted phosphorylase